MGAEKAEGLSWGMPELMASQEQPVATITIAHSYAIGRTEVTRAQFAEFVEATGYETKEGCSHLTSEGWSTQPELTWRDTGIGASDDHPAPCLRRAEMLACAFQNGADRTFVKVAASIPYGQFADCDDGYAFTSPVASFEPNAFGLYDVAGNVSEWTADCYATGHANAPRDGTPYDERPCGAWVAKGGSWAGFPGLLRLATRLPIRAASAGSGFGFRVARDVN